MVIVYDNAFNRNEWFVIISLLIEAALVWRLRKRFPAKEALVFFMYYFFLGMVMDHTISIEPYDFYDVNDTSSYQLMDFLTYMMYGFYGYLYIFIYDYFKIKPTFTPVYILVGAIVSMALEALSNYMGIFHYKNGYTLYYSFPIYLPVLSSIICLYRFVLRQRVHQIH